MSEVIRVRDQHYERTKASLKRFYKELEPELEKAGFEEDQNVKIKEAIFDAQSRLLREIDAQSQPENETGLNKIVNYVIENPKVVIDFFKVKWQKIIYDIIIAIIVVGAVLTLALTGHLEPTHSATLLGGIIGYLLGHAT